MWKINPTGRKLTRRRYCLCLCINTFLLTGEKVNASSQFEERYHPKTFPTSAAMQTSPSINHENDIVSGHILLRPKTLTALSCLVNSPPGDMVDIVPSRMDKPPGRMSLSMTVGDEQTAVEFHENEFSMTLTFPEPYFFHFQFRCAVYVLYK